MDETICGFWKMAFIGCFGTLLPTPPSAVPVLDVETIDSGSVVAEVLVTDTDLVWAASRVSREGWVWRAYRISGCVS